MTAHRSRFRLLPGRVKTTATTSKSLRVFSAVFLFTAISLVAVPFVYAQRKKSSKGSRQTYSSNKTELEKKKKNLESQINFTNQLLSQTRRNKTLSLVELAALNKKIETRESLIATIQSEISGLDGQIADNNAIVTDLDTEITHLKNDYARMIRFAYRNRDGYQRMMFIFAAKDFNQAFLRMKYMQQIGEHRREQADTILARQRDLNENIRSLEQQKAEKKQLLDSQETEQGQLAKEKDEKDKTFRSLQAKEGQLKTDLEKKKKEKVAIENAIQQLIAEELRREEEARRKAAAAKSSSKSSASNTPPKLSLTPEAEKLGNSFAANHGALPWPVVQGTIIGHYGKQPHPVLKDVYIDNPGIYIATAPGADARAVFDGEVTGVTSIPGAGWLVIVRHGEYLTVYAQLQDVDVKTGDKVKTKQQIGKIANDSDAGEPILLFEVWKSGSGKMDPEDWLLKGN